MNKFLKFIMLLSLLIMMCGCTSNQELNYTVDDNVYTINNKKYIESSENTNLVKIDVENTGIMIAELYPDIAPITVENFKKLVSEKFYDNLLFHRVIEGFMIQTGDPTATGTGGSEEQIKGEFSLNGIENNLSHERGVLSMARRGANPDTEETMNSASSQFFIMHKDTPSLDGMYAAFGRVIEGLDVVDTIATTGTNINDKPVHDQKITSIRFVKEYSKEGK